ncbi:hypothetical protein Tco_0483694 [Tanacetum coccineum]
MRSLILTIVMDWVGVVCVCWIEAATKSGKPASIGRIQEESPDRFATALAVLVTRASQSRQHKSHHRFFPVDTSLIHIESRKSPTKSLFDVGSRRISIFTVNTKEYHSQKVQGNYQRIMSVGP